MQQKALNINENPYIIDSSSSIIDHVDKAINKYKSHSSILLMKQKIENVDQFSFKEVSVSEIEKELRELNSNKATTLCNIPTKISLYHYHHHHHHHHQSSCFNSN